MKLLDELIKRHGYSLKRLSAMLGISPKRIAELLANYEPTKEEKHKIETLKRFACMIGRGLNFDDDIHYQQKQIDLIETDLKKRLDGLDPDTQEIIVSDLDAIKSECMYLGCFYSNNNQEEIVQKYVRQARRVIGTEDVK